MRKFLFIVFILVFGLAHANDGSFYASGNTLLPLKETTIRMKKEILSLTRKDNWMQVDIYFEFFNPGPEKELTVGFVTPPAEGDVTDAEVSHPQVKDFMVMLGNELLPYKITRMNETGFKVDQKISDGEDFIYYFQVKFLNGITIIRHSYQYRGGMSVETMADFDYRLTTGTMWANGSIEDFELSINMGDDSYFAVPSAFDDEIADWTLAGIGRMSKPMQNNPYADVMGQPNIKMIYTRKGSVQLRISQFKPEKDLLIRVFELHNEVALWCEKPEDNDFANLMQLLYNDSARSFISRMTDDELRLYRNLHYARMGYDFRDAGLKRAFAKYIWYIPDPSLKIENVPDYYLDKNIQNLVLEEERKRKMKTEEK